VLCGGLPGAAGGGWRLAFCPRPGVGDGQGEVFELGDQGAEPAVVVEPLPVVVELVVGDEPGDGLAAGLAGPLPVGAVQGGRVGVAAAAGLAAADVPLDQGAGQGEYGVNANTITRAGQELERAGVITRYPGRGRVVLPRESWRMLDAKRIDALEAEVVRLRQAVDELRERLRRLK
jgi:hypothetical protein